MSLRRFFLTVLCWWGVPHIYAGDNVAGYRCVRCGHRAAGSSGPACGHAARTWCLTCGGCDTCCPLVPGRRCWEQQRRANGVVLLGLLLFVLLAVL